MRFSALALLALAALCQSPLAAEAAATTSHDEKSGFMFVGHYKPKHQNGGFQCSDSRLVARKAASKEEAKTFYNEFNAEAPASSYRGVDLFVPERSGVVIQYLRRYTLPDCTSKSISILQGNDAEDLKTKIAAFRKEYSKYILSEPTVILAWDGNGLRSTTSEIIDNVEIRYRAGTSGSGKTSVVVQMINHNPDKTAVILFKVNDKFGEQRFRLGPNLSGSHFLGNNVTSFGAAVVLMTPEDTDKLHEDSLINKVKDAMRSHLMKEGKIDTSSGSGTAPEGGSSFPGTDGTRG